MNDASWVVAVLAAFCLGWLIGRSGRASTGPSLPTVPRPAPPGEVDAAAFPDVVEWYRAGKKINAIKALREHTGLGLADAKRAVERLG